MISLTGEWRFQMGYEEAEPSEIPFEDRIQIPGILQGQGYGEEISYHTHWVSSLHDPMWYLREEYQRGQKEGVKVPFLSQPPRHYLGVAWYQRKISVEEGFYELRIECTRWRTQAYLDGMQMGEVTALCAPHCFSLGRLAAGEHTITVRIDNRMLYPYRPDGHGVSDALGATWNGMAGSVELRQIPGAAIGHVRIKPDADRLCLETELVLENRLEEAVQAELTLTVRDGMSHRTRTWTQKLELEPGAAHNEISLDCSEISGGWDEFQPDLQKLEISLRSGEGEDRRELPFGFRRVEVREGRFFVNGHPTYLRGTHFGGDFPLTGYPSTDEADWEKILHICREWGLNFIRFHSYCPPEAAFAAADRLGVYLQVECAMWNTFREGNGMDEILWEETRRILEAFGHHPSFLMLSPSNEPGGDWGPVLAEWYRRCKETEHEFSGQRLYTRQSGWPYQEKPSEITDTDYVYFHRSGYGPHSGGTIRNHVGWGAKDYRASLEGIQYPVITHEMGQWCSYPDFSIIDKFTGYMKPGNYEVFRESARESHVLEQNQEFVKASGMLQAQMYKEDLEANFRTPHIYGFELLDLHDYLGQGGAFVGILDAFWDNKGYIMPEEFRRFCGETVLLLRIAKRVFTEGEKLECPAELCHFGRNDLKGARVCWRLTDSTGAVIRRGSFASRNYGRGKNQEIGSLELDLAGLRTPECYTVELYLENTEIRNQWNIWVYENAAEIPALNRAVYTRSLKEAVQALEEGRRVVYCPYSTVMGWNSPYLSERPVFWNAQMGPRWSRGMGICCDASHPALKYFPTRDYQEYQWSDILRDARGINLKDYPAKFRPVVQPIDEWNRNYKLGLVLEARVGGGSLLLVSSDLERNLETSPAKRQLLRSLLLYADSEEFQPAQEISRECFLSSFADIQIMRRLGGTMCLLEKPELDLSAAFDGNPNTTFQTDQPGYPYTIELSWGEAEEMAGLLYMPVQNQRNHDGDIREYEVLCRNGDGWETAAAGELPSSFEPKRILFEKPVCTDCIRFIAKSGFGAEGLHTYLPDADGWQEWEGSMEERGISIAELVPISSRGVWAAKEDGEENRTAARTATIEIEE